MRLHISTNDDLGQTFREAAMKRFGYKQGALKKAVEEAIEDWLQKR